MNTAILLLILACACLGAYRFGELIGWCIDPERLHMQVVSCVVRASSMDKEMQELLAACDAYVYPKGRP